MKGFYCRQLTLAQCNIDDMTPELFPYIFDLLLAQGARDVWVEPILMKKGRPGHLLSLLCGEAELETLLNIVFRETTTIGVRVQDQSRYELQRETQQVSTPFGLATVKIARSLDGKVMNVAPEHSSCLEIAKLANLPLKDCYQLILREFQKQEL